MKDADDAVEDGGIATFGPGNRENIADEHVLEVLGLAGGLAHEKNGGCGGNGVGDTDKGFLRDVAPARASESEDSGAEKREREADPVRGPAMRVHADDDGNRGAEGGDLRESKVDKNNASFHNMHAHIRVNAGQAEP